MEKDLRHFGEHIRRSHTISGEHQISEYVAGLELGDCIEILGSSPVSLRSLATHSDLCRVGADESRDFDEVIRQWVVCVLSRVEGG